MASDPAPSAPPAPRTARQRVRAELTAEITAIARRHLAEKGPSELSLRAVAREMGMASSALYRYFPSRDALLTRLIIDAYNDMGDACDAAVDAVDERDHLSQFQALAHGVRGWAVAHPQEYALIYGSPVPGYAAPTDTVDPASRVIRRLILLAITMNEDATAPIGPVAIPEMLERQIATLLDDESVTIDRQRFVIIASVWAQLFGMISFEVFGRYDEMFDDADALFAVQLELAAATIGLTSSTD